MQRHLRRSGLFRLVERNYLARAQEVPNDPVYPTQWALPLVQAPQAWDTTLGFGITLAIVDSGIDGSHLDLAPQLVDGFNVLNGSSDASDDYGHGTRMAGIAAARGFDGYGVIGVAPEGKLMPVKVLDSQGQGTYADVAAGIVYAVDHGARVISLSLGGEVASTTLSNAVAYAMGHGVVLVAAAGNDGIGAPNYPAGYADVIAVAASDSNDQRASFSNYGPWLDLLAPGVDIATTDLGGGFADSTGTSPATPMVAGAAALMLAVNPSLQPSQVASILDMTTQDVGQPGFDNYDGWGRLNVDRAVQQALSLAGRTDSAPPTVQVTTPSEGDVTDGVVTLSASTSDDTAVARIEFTVDGVVVGVSSAAPFEVAWNSATAVPGPHVLRGVAFDDSGNQGLSAPVNVVVAGSQAGCDTSDWTCLPGGGALRTDCFAEWLVRADTIQSTRRQKAAVTCVDGSACDADGVADGNCTFAVGVCFSVSDARLVDRKGNLACDPPDDFTDFEVVLPGIRRSASDPTDAANSQSLLSGVAALSSGLVEGRCAVGIPGRACTINTACDSAVGAHDGVCSLESTSLSGVGGAQACTAVQLLRVPLRHSGSKLRKSTRVLKTITSSSTPKAAVDADALTLECLPAS